MPNVSIRPCVGGPHEQGLIFARISDERVIAQADPPGVDRHRDVDMLVGIDPDTITFQPSGCVVMV